MTPLQRRHDWTNKTLKVEALKYTSRRKFKFGYPGAYGYMMKHQEKFDLNYICNHMTPVVSWNYKNALQEALLYNTMSEIKHNKVGCYSYILKHNDLLAEVRSYMKKGGNGFNPQKPATFYFARIYNGLYKFGITNRSFERRYEKQDRDKMTVIYEMKFLNGQDAVDLEKEISKKFSHLKYKGERVLKGAGITEILTAPISLYCV